MQKIKEGNKLLVCSLKKNSVMLVSHTRLPERESGELARVKLCRRLRHSLSTLARAHKRRIRVHKKRIRAHNRAGGSNGGLVELTN